MSAPVIEWLEPASGDFFRIPAGGTIKLVFIASNAEERSITYRLDVEGLPPGWLPEGNETRIAPLDEQGRVTLTIVTEVEASGSDFSFDVRLSKAGTSLWPMSRQLRLEIVEPITTVGPAVLDNTVAPVTSEPSDPKSVQVEAPAQGEPSITEPSGGRPPERKIGTFETPPKATPSDLEAAGGASGEDRVVVDPKDGHIIHARPGERILVRLGFTRKGDRAVGRQEGQTFVLQEDRALPRGWIRLVRDQVNVLPNGRGELTFMLEPPLDAEPVPHPFAIETGPLGQQMAVRHLVLNVQPVPALKVRAESPSQMAYHHREVELPFVVALAGNADTAYRLSVRALNGQEDLQETPRYIYFLDQELGNLASPTVGRSPDPAKHRVRVVRKGIWWTGRKEQHQFRVIATPVTGGVSDAKRPNEIELTATFTRILPFPWQALVGSLGVVAFALLFVGSPTDLTVTNAITVSDGIAYVLADRPVDQGAPVSVPVRLNWRDSLWPGGAIRRHGNETTSIKSRQDSVPLRGEYLKEFGYEVKGLWSGTGTQRVMAVTMRKPRDFEESALVLVDQTFAEPQRLDPEIRQEKLGGVTRSVAHYTFQVPADGVGRLTFVNYVPKRVGGYSLWLVQTQKPRGFSIADFAQSGSALRQLNNEATQTVKIRPNGSAEAGVWELLSTDPNAAVIRIHLERTSE